MPSSDDATRKLRSGSREPLLRVERLHIHFAVKQGLLRRRVGSVRAVDGVDLRLLQGQTLALVGETGAGKSALVRGLVRLVPVHAGRVSFEGKDVLGMSKSDLRALARQIQTVTPEALLPNAASALAALLEQGAKLLIFDSAFDSISDRERLSLFEALRRAQDERGLTCLLLTRDLKLAAALAEDVAVMYRGQIVETGAAADVLARPQHPYTQALLGSKAADTTKSEPPVSGAFEAGCRFRMRCPYAFTRCAREEPVLFAVAGGTSRCFLEDPAAAGS